MIGRRAALALIATAALTPQLVRADDAVIRLGGSASDAFAQGAYAEAGGFFKQAGLSVEQVMLANSGAIASALAGGSIDVGLANPISLANAVESGLPFVAIAPSALFLAAHPQSLMVVAKTSPIQSAKDFDGKTIALIQVRSMTQTSTSAWLRKSGVDPGGVKFIEMPFSAMLPALAGGRIDGAFIAETSLRGSADQTRSLGCPDAALAPEWYLNVWYTTKPWLAKNMPVARRFAQTIQRSAAWANAHQSETGAVLQKIAGLPGDAVAKMTRTQFASSFDIAHIQPVIDAAIREGAVKRSIDAHEFVLL